MNKQNWQLYECTFHQSIPICSSQLIENFVTLDLAKSSLLEKNWRYFGDTLETEPEPLENSSDKLKYYSIRPRLKTKVHK